MTKAAAGTLVPLGAWQVDASHSSVEFGVKHLMIATVKGTFREFEGSFTAGEDGSVSAGGLIRAASIDTNEPQRDGHLRSPDFFDVEGFPEIRFRSTSVEPAGEAGRFRVLGELTIRNVARTIELDATLEGQTGDPWGKERVALVLRGQLDPNDYGVDWNQELEGGGFAVGDLVDFTVNVSAVKAD